MRIIILSLALLTSSICLAQFENSKWLFTASLEDPIDLSELRIYPDAAYAFKDNAVVGMSMRFYNLNNQNRDGGTLTDEYQRNYFTVSPYYEHYFPIGSRWFFTLRGYASISWSTTNSTDYFTDGEIGDERLQKSRGFGAGVSPGITYQLKDWMMIKGTLGGISFRRNKRKNSFTDSFDNSSTNWTIDSSLNSNVDFSQLSVIFILPNKD